MDGRSLLEDRTDQGHKQCCIVVGELSAAMLADDLVLLLLLVLLLRVRLLLLLLLLRRRHLIVALEGHYGSLLASCLLGRMLRHLNRLRICTNQGCCTHA